jgi:hypothetical protein
MHTHTHSQSHTHIKRERERQIFGTWGMVLFGMPRSSKLN